MQETMHSETSQLQQCTLIAQAFLTKYTRDAAPGDLKKSLLGVVLFLFGTFVTGYAALGPNAGPRSAMSYLLPGFFVVMTLVMVLELRNFYLWKYHKNAYVLKSLLKEAKNHVEIRYTLGYAYQEGALGVRDLQQAAQWYEKAKGYAFADNDLGVLYAKGLGVGQDLHRAHRLFQAAAASGAMPAAQNLKIVKALETF